MPAAAPPPALVAAGDGPRLGAIGRVGRFCARHRGWVIVAWLVIAAAAFVANQHLGGTYADDFTLPSSPAQQGADLLQRHDSAAGGQSGQIVFAVDSGTLAEHRESIESAVDHVRDTAHVRSVSDPFQRIASDGRTSYATVQFADNPANYGGGYVTTIDDAVRPAVSDGVEVDYGGQLGTAARPKGRDIRSEGIGIAIAVVVLLIGFGSLYAAGLPILTAVIGGVLGIGTLGLIARSTTFPQVSPTLAIMIGLGVGIDYALFLTTRHRQLVLDGVDPVEAAARSSASSGRAVLTAALTVIIALLGLYASGVGFIGELGVAGSVGVLTAALSALTLVPAMLALAGARIDRLHVRRPVAEPSGDDSTWSRYGRAVGRRSWLFLVAGLTIVVVLAVPLFSMQLGHVAAGADPSSYSDKRAYDRIADAFGSGANGPLTIVIDVDGATTSTTAIADSVRRALADSHDVASVSQLRATPDGDVLTGTVIPASDPQSPDTDALVRVTQDSTLPQALRDTGAHGYVTGSLAGQLQFRDLIAARLPLIILVVVAAAFLLLVLSFRSPVLALKAAVMNVLSVGAAYGVIVAVFQWGWGGALIGVSQTVPIESYVPMMMFAIVFGLSMDYEVFLLSRVRDVWLATGDNARAVTTGLSQTARVITCAALIMAGVFFSFAASPNIVIKVLAVGLGSSVLIDAFVVRLLLVPAAMFLLGRASWWAPRWLRASEPHSGLSRSPLGSDADRPSAEVG